MVLNQGPKGSLDCPIGRAVKNFVLTLLTPFKFDKNIWPLEYVAWYANTCLFYLFRNMFLNCANYPMKSFNCCSNWDGPTTLWAPGLIPYAMGTCGWATLCFVKIVNRASLKNVSWLTFIRHNSYRQPLIWHISYWLALLGSIGKVFLFSISIYQLG